MDQLNMATQTAGGRARVLPYDLAFEDPAFETHHFPAIRDEAEAKSMATEEPERFLQLHNVGAILRTLLVDADETAVEQLGPLLFQAYHFWAYGKPVYELDEPAFRNLVGERAPMGSWPLRPPMPAGYLSLPRNLLWARIREDEIPEAVDGLFWTMVGAHDAGEPPFPRLDVLLALGLLSGRPGFSIADVDARPETEPDGHWGDAQMRTGSPDFANVLPGGELQQLHALETTGEVLKLLSRVFRYIADHPEAVQQSAEDGHWRVTLTSE